MAGNISTVLNFAGGALDDFGGAAADLLSVGGYNAVARGYHAVGLGYHAEGEAYGQASALSLASASAEDKVIGLTKLSTQLQQSAVDRQVFQVVGGAKADIGAAGLEEHGSALDVVRSSMHQGEIQKQLLQTQGMINVRQEEIQQNAFNVQAGAYHGQELGAYAAETQAYANETQAYAAADSAKAAGAAKAGSGILKTIGTIAGLAALFI